MPTLIVPYPGADDRSGYQDIFVYLRPETNGVLAESTILKVIKDANGNHADMKLVFLANFPGEFMVKKQVVEQYYALKFHFAVAGKAAFTETMKEQVCNWYKVNWEEAPLIGAFDALKLLNLQPEDLFNTWVPECDVFVCNGQCIKKIHEQLVVNYDIPALIHKNSRGTDIAVMMFRTSLGYGALRDLVLRMHKALCDAGILNPQYDAARAFHYSKSPFEQLLDGLIYLGADERLNLGLKDMTFMRFLMSKQADLHKVVQVLMNPIVHVKNDDGTLVEEHFLQTTQFASYESAYERFSRIESVVELIHHSPLLARLRANN